MKRLGLLLALASSATFAQVIDSNTPWALRPDGGVILKKGCLQLPDGSLLCAAAGAQSGPQTFYVDPAFGNDANACLGPGDAGCATQQAAYNKKSKWIRYTTNIQLACGSYDAGFFAEGDQFIYDGVTGGPAPSAANSPSLNVLGSWVTDTIATGAPDGGVAAATQGGIGTGVDYRVSGTFSIANGGWTTNDLVNRFVQITAGTDLGEIRSIVSNDAGVATISGNWAVTPDTSSAYAIVTPCSLVKDGLVEEQQNDSPTLVANNTKSAAYVFREGLASPSYVPQVNIIGVKIDVLQGGNGIVVEGPGGNYLQQTNLFVNAGGVSNVSNSSGFSLDRNGAMVHLVSNVFAPTVAEFGFVAHSVVGTFPATVNSPSQSGSPGVDLRYNVFAYGTISGNVGPAHIQGARLATFQNYATVGGFSGLNLQGGAWQGIGDHCTLSGTNTTGACVSFNFNSGGSAPVIATLLSTSWNGNGNSTAGLYTNFSYAQSAVCWNDINNTVNNFGWAFWMGANTTLSCHVPTPTGSTSADFLSSNGNGPSVSFSKAQQNAWGYFFDMGNLNLVQ